MAVMFIGTHEDIEPSEYLGAIKELQLVIAAARKGGLTDEWLGIVKSILAVMEANFAAACGKLAPEPAHTAQTIDLAKYIEAKRRSLVPDLDEIFDAAWNDGPPKGAA